MIWLQGKCSYAILAISFNTCIENKITFQDNEDCGIL